MFGAKITYIGTTVFQPGTHFVFRFGLDARKLKMGKNDYQSQLFCPSGYTIVNASYNEILFVNQVPVEAAVYEKKGKKFSSDFGTPAVLNKRR